MRETINPYRFAARLVAMRLMWDLSLKSFSSRARLHRLRNSYRGKKCIIVCNGPSLRKLNFSLLTDTYCFGLNKINLLFNDCAFRPQSIVAVNKYVIEQNLSFYNKTDIPLFITSKAARQVPLRSNVVFIHECERARVARDVSISMAEGGTVTAAALQIAFHMGFRDVALVGCDHYFAVSGRANSVVVSEGADSSHFSEQYFDKGQKWELPDLPKSEFYYSLCGSMFGEHGGRVVNATEGGHLEVFPRMQLEYWLTNIIQAV